MALDDRRFAHELERRFGDELGRLAVPGRRWAYPLGLLMAERASIERLVLVGDASHSIHPIAGQGLNLGIRDVAALAEVLVDASRLGLDLGMTSILDRYERWRRFDTLSLVAATDGLNRLFRTASPPVQLIRDLGLAVVNELPALKRLFMRHAMGTLGRLPRLVQGEAL
jgi:2-octaprenyl-6-methoxyphenol hydroxylase